jgi:hypothetical protein
MVMRDNGEVEDYTEAQRQKLNLEEVLFVQR